MAIVRRQSWATAHYPEVTEPAMVRWFERAQAHGAVDRAGAGLDGVLAGTRGAGGADHGAFTLRRFGKGCAGGLRSCGGKRACRRTRAIVLCARAVAAAQRVQGRDLDARHPQVHSS